MYRCVRAADDKEEERYPYQITYLDTDNVRHKLYVWASDPDEARTKLFALRSDCVHIQDIVRSDS